MFPLEECDIYTWGASPKGTLGHGEETEELVPRVVEALLGRNVRQVACGTEHTLAVTGISLLLFYSLANFKLHYPRFCYLLEKNEEKQLKKGN